MYISFNTSGFCIVVFSLCIGVSISFAIFGDMNESVAMVAASPLTVGFDVWYRQKNRVHWLAINEVPSFVHFPVWFVGLAWFAFGAAWLVGWKSLEYLVVGVFSAAALSIWGWLIMNKL